MLCFDADTELSGIDLFVTENVSYRNVSRHLWKVRDASTMDKVSYYERN
jgi:hypothetical protein